MEIREAIRTNGTVRSFTDEPVDDATITSVLDDARFAPSGGNPFNVVDYVKPADIVPNKENALLEHIDSIPVVLAVAADMSKLAMMDAELDRAPLTGGASIYPFCWNLMLSARAHGLGGVMTTFLSRVEPAAAPALGLPEHHALVTTIFLGHPVHQPTKLKRNPVESFASVNRFDGASFGGPM